MRQSPGIVSDLARRMLETLETELKLCGVTAFLPRARPPSVRAELPGTIGETVHVQLDGDAVQYRWCGGNARHPVDDPRGAATRIADSLATRRRRARAVVAQVPGGDERVDALLMLSGPLRMRGYRTEVTVPATPFLRVESPEAGGGRCRVTVDPGEPAVYVGWGEHIAPMTDVEGAVDHIADVLRDARP